MCSDVLDHGGIEIVNESDLLQKRPCWLYGPPVRPDTDGKNHPDKLSSSEFQGRLG